MALSLTVKAMLDRMATAIDFKARWAMQSRLANMSRTFGEEATIYDALGQLPKTLGLVNGKLIDVWMKLPEPDTVSGDRISAMIQADSGKLGEIWFKKVIFEYKTFQVPGMFWAVDRLEDKSAGLPPPKYVEREFTVDQMRFIAEKLLVTLPEGTVLKVCKETAVKQTLTSVVLSSLKQAKIFGDFHGIYIDAEIPQIVGEGWRSYVTTLYLSRDVADKLLEKFHPPTRGKFFGKPLIRVCWVAPPKPLV